jgi:predicted DNA-binding transcriptional regulator AlpA
METVYGLRDIIEASGASRANVYRYKAQRWLPAPDFMLGHHLIWRKSTFDKAVEMMKNGRPRGRPALNH